MPDISSDADRERWNRKYREAATVDTRNDPDPFLQRAFSDHILPLYPNPGRALDFAGGAGRNGIWLAKKNWNVTLIDISDAGVERARSNAGSLASQMYFVVDDLTHFKAPQTQFDVVLNFFYLDREIFPEMLRAVREGGLLVYKTYTSAQKKLSGGPVNRAYWLKPGELLQMADGLQVLHYREEVTDRATAELVAIK
jgi:tellurite methyltransferase